MKPLKGSELEAMTTEELNTKLADLIDEQFRLRFRTATEAVENPIGFRIRRRNIARIRTVLGQRAGGPARQTESQQ